MMILWFVIFIAVAWFYFDKMVDRRGALNSFSGIAHSNALEILKARYARGEIDQAEFEDRKHNLMD